MSEVRSGGIGVLGLLGVLFVGLKLTNFIDWSWWYVLLPFYGVTVLIVGILVVAAFIAGLAAIAVKTIENNQTKKRIEARRINSRLK